MRYAKKNKILFVLRIDVIGLEVEQLGEKKFFNLMSYAQCLSTLLIER